eukprot:jgi/Botrbrau1/16161/Bobra.0309s0010.1
MCMQYVYYSLETVPKPREVYRGFGMLEWGPPLDHWPGRHAFGRSPPSREGYLLLYNGKAMHVCRSETLTVDVVCDPYGGLVDLFGHVNLNCTIRIQFDGTHVGGIIDYG